MRDDLGVGLRSEVVAVGHQFGAQFGEILDDAIVDDRHAVGEMRMSVGFVRYAVRGPAGMADADAAAERLLTKTAFQVDQLALRAAARQRPVLDRGDAGRIIATVLQPLQSVDDERRHRRLPHYCDDATHLKNPRSAFDNPRFP